MRPIRANARQRTQILSPLGSGPFDVIFKAQAIGGGTPSGQVEESWRGMVGRSSKIHELKDENRFRVGLMTRGYQLALIPDGDVEVIFLTRHTQITDVLKWAGIGIGVLICLSLIMRLIGAITG